ncbi:hypothetical protein E3N88_19996 [Mikania micrantha]|uniref:No apical meristem-associated C-terminal domain-containing protein n=1 Tax=Mikania micrantha TaxID=192012 RepID=A0A5N6NHM1_9ASTR|nr:hypothetical protein E3N88_19996 [Mikania micrantha]
MQQNSNTQWRQLNPQNGFSSFSQSGFQPGISSFTQPGFQQSVPQLRHEPDFVSNDVVLETQKSQKRRKKGSERKTRKQVEVAVQWHQNHGLMTKKPRSEDVTSIIPRTRPTEMSAKLMRFSGIYSNYANNRKSGMNDGEANKGQSSSKSTKNSETNEYSSGGSDAHTVNLEQDEEYDEFKIQEPVRPVGQDTTKRASSSSRQTPSSIPTTKELAHQLEEFTIFQKTKHEDRLLRADLKVMGTVPPEELSDEEREIMRKLRAKIFDRYC